MERNKILLATGNAHKAAELRVILPEYEILTLKDIFFPGEIDENGDSFEQNALIKARALRDYTGLCAIADDSGLSVDYLDGAPGIYSARFAGEHANDKKNNEKLIELMSDCPKDKRSAHFVCAAAVAFPDGGEEVKRAQVDGTIRCTPAGDGGFGYDPYFTVFGYSKTYAEMSSEEKNAISHRKLAFIALKPVIEEFFEKMK